MDVGHVRMEEQVRMCRCLSCQVLTTLAPKARARRHCVDEGEVDLVRCADQALKEMAEEGSEGAPIDLGAATQVSAALSYDH
jgi:hypothetical protein